MSNWGKAHINNTNGFGQAGVNNDNGYGSVYDKSESGDTALNPSPTYFAMTIDSTKSGVSNNDQFQFTGAVGQYEVDAVQNDVVVQSYTGLVDEQTITLPIAGIYQVRVKPTGTNPFNRIKFDRGGDKDKVLTIDSFGTVEWLSFEKAFKGCDNLTTSETNPDLSNVTNMSQMFANTLLFNGNITSWNISNITNMQGMFFFADSFNQDIGNWDTSSVTDIESMFFFAKSFNKDIGNWDTFNVTQMRLIFDNAESFKQDISAWNVEQVSRLDRMFDKIDMNIAGTTTNYDNLLIKWSQQNVQQNVPFGAGDSKYNPNATLPGYSVTAGQAKQILVNKGWSIVDGGTI